MIYNVDPKNNKSILLIGGVLVGVLALLLLCGYIVYNLTLSTSFSQKQGLKNWIYETFLISAKPSATTTNSITNTNQNRLSDTNNNASTSSTSNVAIYNNGEKVYEETKTDTNTNKNNVTKSCTQYEITIPEFKSNGCYDSSTYFELATLVGSYEFNELVLSTIDKSIETACDINENGKNCEYLQEYKEELIDKQKENTIKINNLIEKGE